MLLVNYNYYMLIIKQKCWLTPVLSRGRTLISLSASCGRQDSPSLPPSHPLSHLHVVIELTPLPKATYK